MPAPSVDPALSFRSMPELAAALRDRKQAIVMRWQEAVKEIIPDADPLTRAEVRDTIPRILDHLILAMESADPGTVQTFAESTKEHGYERFKQDYNVREFLREYRILSQVVFEEVGTQLGGTFTIEQAQAIVSGIEIAVEVGTSNFVRHLSQRMRRSAEGEIRFISFLSHDLRNNLNVMLLTLELVR